MLWECDNADLDAGGACCRPLRSTAPQRLEMALLCACDVTRKCHVTISTYASVYLIKVFCFAGVYVLYYPPKHPRGVPWKEALRGLDWVGIVLFVCGGTL